MADPAFYEPEEDDLLSTLAVPQYGGQQPGSYEDDYRRMQELERHAYAQHAEQAQADGELGVQLDMVHEDVKRVRGWPVSVGVVQGGIGCEGSWLRWVAMCRQKRPTERRYRSHRNEG